MLLKNIFAAGVILWCVMPAMVSAGDETVGIKKPPTVTADSSDGVKAEDGDEEEAMELGGIVTVDATAPVSAISDATMEIGTVELSAVVNVAQGVTASITVLAESDLTAIAIDGAVVEWAPTSRLLTVVFGQQTYNFGLLTTQMISDPLIIDNVETAGPGLTASVTHRNVSGGIAVLYEPVEGTMEITHKHNTEGAAVYDTTESGDEGQKFIGNLYCDYSFTDAAMARVSLLGNSDELGVDVGFGYAGEALAVDAEFYINARSEAESRPAGWFTGLAWNFGELISTAVRYDALSENAFDNISQRIGGGVTLHMPHGIFLAMEYGHTFIPDADSEGEVALQLGLESTLKLPGFQRRTLTKK